MTVKACLFDGCLGPAQGPKICGNSFADIRVCPSCGMQRIDPPRSQDQLDALHSDPAYFNHPYFAARRTLDDTKRLESYRRIIHELFPEGVPTGARLLDVGCDTGAFLDVARKDFNMSVAGVEISHTSAEIAKAKGFDVYLGSIMDVEIPEKFDAIVLNDVIEHVAHPDRLVEILASLLKPNGRLFISTPNGNAFIYTIGQCLFKLAGRIKLLDKLYLPYHEWYFPPKALADLVKEKGLKVASHRLVEFPLSEFGHGTALKFIMAQIFIIQKILHRPSVQFLIAQKQDNS